MNEITTNERFDRLTNLDISTHHRNGEYWLFVNDFKAAMAYWITAQNPNIETIEVKPAIDAYEKYLRPYVDNILIPQKFSYEELNHLVSEDVFGSLPEVLALNNLKPDFIDLGALARNVFFMLLREQITQA